MNTQVLVCTLVGVILGYYVRAAVVWYDAECTPWKNVVYNGRFFYRALAALFLALVLTQLVRPGAFVPNTQ